MIKYFMEVILVLGFVSGESELQVCGLFENCWCSENTGNGKKCPSSNKNVTIYLSDKSIKISCDNHSKHESDIISYAESCEVKLCLKNENVSHLKSLKLENCELGKGTLLNINSTFFDGLQHLETITINQSLIKFGHNVFEKLSNLTKIDLMNNNLAEITYIFKDNSGVKFLDLSMNFLENLPSGVFENLSKLETLILWGNKLTNIRKDYFTGLKSLEILDLRKNSIYYLEEDSFHELAKLVRIRLESNKLSTIKSDVFKNSLKLERITLEHNTNLSLSDYVFANLVNLINLSMYSCGLKTIPEHSFENCTNLLFLDLHNNALEILPQNLFKSLGKLKMLNLKGNKLKSLPNKVFSSLINLEKLDLEDNLLDALNTDTLKNLSYLTLRNNKIVHIEAEDFAFQTELVILDLSHNQLIELTSFLYKLEKVEKLLLIHNNISTFPTNVLVSLKNLKELDLSNNKLNVLYITDLVKLSKSNVEINLINNTIKYIDFDGAEEISRSNKQSNLEIDVSHNPLECNCKNFELVKYLRNQMDPVVKSFANISVKDVKCSQPADFRNVAIKNLNPEEITDEYKNKECPSDCRCYKRCSDGAILVDCSLRNLTHIPNITMEGNIFEVNLVGNLLTSGPTENNGYKNVRSLYLSNNKLNTFDWCPPSIEKLALDNNMLNALKPNVLKVLKASANFSKITLSNNRWTCDCSASDLKNFIHSIKLNDTDVICEEDNVALAHKEKLCKSKIEIIAQFTIPILILFFLVALVWALYFRYETQIKIWLYFKNWCQWYITEEELDKDKPYDVFLCFSHKDQDFVIEDLLPRLEKNFKVCIHVRNWIGGVLINDQINDSVYKSRRTLVVLSNNFLESTWGKQEFLTAHTQSIEDGRPRVIVIKYGDLNVEKMNDEYKAYIKMHTYVDWDNPNFWKQLFYALPHSRKNTLAMTEMNASKVMKIDDELKKNPHRLLDPEFVPLVRCNTSALKKTDPQQSLMRFQIYEYRNTSCPY